MIIDANLTAVHSNIRVFTRLVGLDSDPLHFKNSSSEFDACDALDCASILLKDTKRFVGKRKHPGKPFDFIEDVKADMSVMLLQDDDIVKQAIKRKRHLPLVYLVVGPALDALSQYDHLTAIDKVDEVFDIVKNALLQSDTYGEYDDAVVAQAQVKRLIQHHDEQAKLAASVRKKKNRKVEKELEAEIKEETDVDVD